MMPPRASLRSAPRTCLVVPATDERKIAKALASTADEVVLDLEDAVEPGSKARARESAAAVIAHHAASTGSPRLAVRVNQVGTPWCHLDVLAVAEAASGPLTVVVPKVEHPAHLTFVDHLLTGALGSRQQPLAHPDIDIDALVESAAGIRALEAILTSSNRLRAIVIGYADLGADLGCDFGTSPGAEELRASVRSTVLLAARATGRFVIDGPWLSVVIDDDFIRDRKKASQQGFDGSWAIHPAQLETINELFSATSEQLDWAHRVLEALASAAEAGAGAVALEGQMLDEAIALSARRILARADARHA